MLTVFLASLWDGCTEFSLDRERLDSALAMLDAEARDADEADVLIVPIVGLRMPLPRLQLPHGVRIVRADAIEAPIEAMRSEGMGRAAWEPQFLAVAEQGDEPDGAEAALQPAARADQRDAALQGRRHRPRPLRLRPDRRGPLAPDRHRRPRHPPRRLPAQRGGGRASWPSSPTALEARPDPDGALAWAVGRFEMGCERESALEGLSDHLLALRAVLEGHGPVGASLPMRAAALIADESLRPDRGPRAGRGARSSWSAR